MAPCYGAPRMDKDGNKRSASIKDYVKLAKLFQTNDDYHVNGGLMVNPMISPSKTVRSIYSMPHAPIPINV